MQLQYSIICDLVNHISQVPTRYFSREKMLLCVCPGLRREEDFVQTDKLLLDEIFTRCAASRYPILFATDLDECLGAIPVDYGEGLEGIFIVGPVLTSEVSYDGILQYSRERNLPIQYTHKLLQKYQKMMIMRMDRFGALPKLIYFQLYQKSLDTMDMTLVSGKAAYQAELSESELSENLTVYRELQEHVGSYQYEESILDLIRRGDLIGLKQYIAKNDPFAPRIFSKKNPLRQNKNVLIYYSGLAAHAAIKGGLLPEVSYAVCEHYVQQAEELQNLLDVSALMLKMLQEFARRVESVSHTNCSRPVIRSREYIFHHLYEEIRIPELAQYAGVSSNYLSDIFHKEMGQTITVYIQTQKIAEAQKLLRYTKKTVLEVSTLLGFRSQSYFSSVFKKFSGVSPGEYRHKTKR